MANSSKKVFDTTFSTYQEVRFLDEGGNGKVYEVTNVNGEHFALKYLDPGKASSEKRGRFKNEIYFCSKTDHPNIVRVLDHGLYDDGGKKGASPFYVMALYETSLRNLMKDGIEKSKTLRYFGQILDGVEAAHLLSVVHRDLKPENILYDKHKDKLVVADFGIAHFVDEDQLTAVETAPGTRVANFQYAAPEQRTK